MKFLYIYPHPDDESFGPVAGIYQQLEQGHEVHLLTLTRGGATHQRHRLGLSVEEMGEVRYREMQAVHWLVKFTSMTVLDMPDSGLKELDPREIENTVRKHIERLKPDILVSYPVHGISGFHDHLVMHAVIKRLFLQMRDEGAHYLKRLAFTTLPDNLGPAVTAQGVRLKRSTDEEIDCILQLRPKDQEILQRALDCYETYQEVIENIGVLELVGDQLQFELFQESFDPPLTDLTQRLAKQQEQNPKAKKNKAAGIEKEG